ncbi:MAG: guanine deaminase [Pseudomonadota bacterium]|nr:guanine deaminase [Pseudomonadota bacterium]
MDAYRAEIIYCTNDPSKFGESAICHFEDGLLVVNSSGEIVACGEAKTLLKEWGGNCSYNEYKNHLIVPGFIDSHIHFPQTEMLAAHGEQLLSWLENYTYPVEENFCNKSYSLKIANVFLTELLKNGTTSAVVFGSVHKESVDALFELSYEKNMRIVAGKALMDRNVPLGVSENTLDGFIKSKELIDQWHNKGRLSYAVTPRFAASSSYQQLEGCKKLLNDYPDLYLQTHLSENHEEIDFVKKTYPTFPNYLSIYDEFDFLSRPSIFAHCIHLEEKEWDLLSNTKAVISHCPTSNLFLGSGLFDMKKSRNFNIPVTIGTDIGAGTSFSMMQTFSEAYKIQQLQGTSLNGFDGLYLMTLAGAKAINLDHRIGTLEAGTEADFVILNYNSTPYMEFRNSKCDTIHDRLFSLLMLGDDRAVSETYIMGKKKFDQSNCNDTYL